MNDFTNKYITIFVKAIANSSSNKLSDAKLTENDSISLKAHLTASPEKGKANASLINLISKTLKIRKADIEILRGHTSARKVVAVHGISYEKLLQSIHTEV